MLDHYFSSILGNSSTSQIQVGISTKLVINQNAQPTILTPKIVKQIIVLALSTLELQSNGNSSSKFWFIDFGASNHIANLLKNVHPYHGSEHIQVPNENNFSIIVIGRK